MIDQSTNKGRLIAAALRLAGERPWREVQMRDIAQSAGVSLVELRKDFCSKSDIVAAFIRSIDEDVLTGVTKPIEGQSARDAVFEIVMSRFDALKPHKAAVKSMAAGPSLDPSVVRAFLSSQVWMLNAAGVRTEGLGGIARVGGLATTYRSVFDTWLGDEDPGLANTMAVLDRRLRRGESALKTLDSVLSGCCGFVCSCRDALGRRSGKGGTDTSAERAEDASRREANPSENGSSAPA